MAGAARFLRSERRPGLAVGPDPFLRDEQRLDRDVLRPRRLWFSTRLCRGFVAPRPSGRQSTALHPRDCGGVRPVRLPFPQEDDGPPSRAPPPPHPPVPPGLSPDPPPALTLPRLW